MKRYFLKFNLMESEVQEGMHLAGRAVFTGRWRFFPFLQLLVFGFLASITGIGAFHAARLLGGAISFGLGMSVLLVLVGAGVLWIVQLGYKRAAAASVASRFLRYCEVEISPEGVDWRTLDSRWHIGWGDVEAVLSGRETLTLAVAAISLPIPKSAFDSEDEADTAFEHMQDWHHAAVAEAVA